MVAQAGIARGTFYNYFSTIDELYHGLSYNLSHEYNVAIYRVMDTIETPAEKSAVGLRSYLRQTLRDRRWGWGMVNISAYGPIFGAETFENVRLTVMEGIACGDFTYGTAESGRDFQLGALLAGMTALLHGAGPEHGDRIVLAVLRGLGVAHQRAVELVKKELPEFEIQPE